LLHADGAPGGSYLCAAQVQRQLCYSRTDLCLFSFAACADGAPVVPLSAQLKYNVDVVCEYIEKRK
jgi:translation initiation factor 2 gamma subunit (eIF-2gamma)